MTTAAHVLLPREVVDAIRSYLCERRREAAAHLPCVVSAATVTKLDRHISALDAALNADEAWERISERVVWVVDTDGEPTIRLEKLLNVGIVLERPDGESLSLSPGHNPTAVALALLALAAAGGER